MADEVFGGDGEIFDVAADELGGVWVTSPHSQVAVLPHLLCFLNHFSVGLSLVSEFFWELSWISWPFIFILFLSEEGGEGYEGGNDDRFWLLELRQL